MLKKLFDNRFLAGLMLAVLLLNLVFLFWYIFVGYQNHFHSDSAAKVLLAREIYDSGHFFPPEWWYTNSDLWVLFGHVWVLPLLAFLPAGFTAHAISGAIFAVLILYGVWLVSGLGDLPVWRRLLVVAVFAAGVEANMVENLFGQVSYGPIVFSCLCLLFFASKQLVAEGRQKWLWTILLIVLLTLVWWTNPRRAVITYQLPLLGGLVWLAWSAEAAERRKLLALMGFSFVGVLFGILLHVITIENVLNAQAASNVRWVGLEVLPRNIALTLRGLLVHINGYLIANASLFSTEGLLSGMRFVAAWLAILMTPVAIKRAMQGACMGYKLLALFAAFSLLATFFLHATTSLLVLENTIASSRYLVPGIVLCLIVLLMSSPAPARPPVQALALVFVSFVFIIAAPAAYQQPGSVSVFFKQPVENEKQQLIRVLGEKGLQYGYASYWNAGAMTVLSDEKVRIRQILISFGIPVPHQTLGSPRWYKASAWTGKTFLLLQENEVALMDWQKMARLGLVPQEQFTSGRFSIFVFADNIARHLPGWDRRYETPAVFSASNAPSQTGRLVAEGDAAILVAEKGESGALMYGPYVDVEPGQYRVTFDVYAEHHPEGAVRLDIAAAPDQKLYGEKTLNDSSGQQIIDFSLDSTRTMEFRVWALGRSRVTVKAVSIVRLPAEN